MNPPGIFDFRLSIFDGKRRGRDSSHSPSLPHSLPFAHPITLAIILTLGLSSLQAADPRLVEYYRKQLLAHPADTRTQDQLLNLLQKSGELKSWMDQLAAQDTAESAVILGYLYLRQNEPAKARAAFASHPSPLAAQGLADLASAEGKPIEAAQILEKALPENAPTDRLLAVAEKWQAAGDTARADTVWDRILAGQPEASLRTRRARELAGRGNLDAALALWQSVATTTSGETQFAARLETATLLEKAGRFPDAIAALNDAGATLAPGQWQRAQIDTTLLHLHRQAGTLDQLEAEWRETVRQSPGDVDAALRLANLLAETGKFAEQRAVLAAAVAANPGPLRLLRCQAEAEAASGDPAQALAAWETLARRQPDQTDPVLEQAALLIRMDRTAEAITRLETFRRAAPADPGRLSALRKFYEENRLAEPLIALLHELAQADPSELPGLVEQQLNWNQPVEPIDLTRLTVDAPRKAELAAALSEIFARHQHREKAVAWARQAVDFQPTEPASALRVADLLAPDEAIVWLEEWIARNSFRLPPEEIDQRLIQLTTAPPEEAPGSSVQRSLDLIFALAPLSGEAPPEPPVLQRIQANYSQNPHPETARRIARWQRGIGNPAAASATLRLAAGTFPNDVSLKREWMRTLADLGDYPAAIALAREVMQIDASQAPALERQIARYELDRGDLPAAIEIFQRRVEANPKSVEAWRDLATAQQQGDFWFDSLDSWQKAASVATPEERYEMRATFLAIAERLRLPDRAQAFLQTLRAETGDNARRTSLLEESRDLAKRTGTALPETVPATTEDAVPLSADSARIRVYAREPDQLNAWLDLAKASPPEETATVWREIVRRFSRNPEALWAASDYFHRNQELRTSAELAAQALRLGGATAIQHLNTARMFREAGDRTATLEHLTKAWELTTPPMGNSRMFPIRSFGTEAQQLQAIQTARQMQRLRASWRSELPEPPKVPPNAIRLALIEEISRLAHGGAVQKEWLARWRQLHDPAERITGLYFIGETAAALDELAQELKANPDQPAAAQSFASLAVECGDFPRLLALMQSQQEYFSGWLDAFLLALNQQITAFPERNHEALHQAMAEDNLITRALRWPLATLFAAHKRYADAARFGELAMNSQSLPDVSEGALNIAYWHISAGHFDQARKIAAEGREPGAAALTHPALMAARLEWLLSTPEEQKMLRDEARRQSASPGTPPLNAARSALFTALGGNSAEMPEAAERLVQSQKLFAGSDPADHSFAGFIRDSANSLLQWGRPAAATELLRRAVDTDPVLLLLRGQLEGPEREDLRLRLIGARLLSLPPSELKAMLTRLISENTLPLEAVQQLGLFFEQLNHFPAAYWCYQLATDQFGLSEGLLTGRMRTARNGPDSQAWIDTCEVAARDSGIPNQAQYQLAARSQLAHIARFQGRPEEAEKLLKKLIQQSPDNALPVRQLAELYLARNQPQLALSVLQSKEVANKTELLGLQMRTLLALNQIQEAIDLLDRHPKAAPVLLPGLLSASVQNPNLAEWEPELERRATRPEDRYRLLEARARSGDKATREAALKEIPELVRATPGLMASFYLLRKQLARRTNDTAPLIQELMAEWKRGQYFAGEILIQLYLEENRDDELAAILTEFLALDNLNETTLQSLALLLEANTRWNAAAAVYQKLATSYPASSSYRLGLARALTQSGRSEEAAGALAALHQARQVLPGALGALAAFHLENGHPESAQPYLLEMKQTANAQEQSNAYLGLAECALQLGDRSDAEKNLREAATLDLSAQITRLATDWVRGLPVDQQEDDLRRLNLAPPMLQLIRQNLEKANAALPSRP